MKKLVVFGLLLWGWSGAQIVDGRVTNTVDEFTGVRECSQMVTNSALDSSGISITKADGEFTLLFARHVDVFLRDSSFNVFGLMRDEIVYLRFANDDIMTLEALDVGGNREDGYEFAVVDPTIIPQVLASPGDLRVRFEGPRGEHDFTIYHDVIAALVRGFGQECL